MNAVTSFVAIVSLLLALATAGGAAKQETGTKSPAAMDIQPSKIVLNHNETMLSDAPLVQQTDTWSQWLTSMQTFFFTTFSTNAPGPKGGCDESGCGMNHNETMVSDTAR
jgi:hypothetical protein